MFIQIILYSQLPSSTYFQATKYYQTTSQSPFHCLITKITVQSKEEKKRGSYHHLRFQIKLKFPLVFQKKRKRKIKMLCWQWIGKHADKVKPNQK